MMTRRLFAAASLCVLAPFTTVAALPRKAPEFVIKLPNGSQKLLSQYRGKVIVLEFLLTTCSHCKVTSRIMSKLQAEYGARGLVSIGVAVNEGAAMKIPAYAQETGANFVVGFSDHGPAINFLQHPANKNFMVPRIVFIDRAGMIRADRGGGNDDEFFKNEEATMRAIIESMLGPARGSARKAAPRK